ncbi:TUBB4B [Branchiostoma lanceolatum]|uniref:TUBB4B protein n=1 Tax=Branchiostoma lanceolatum TaxID=7740 RepID=A0A8J9W907_BRALA|nr:TUBB4B [Branchiostoma lanceolatum]
MALRHIMAVSALLLAAVIAEGEAASFLEKLQHVKDKKVESEVGPKDYDAGTQSKFIEDRGSYHGDSDLQLERINVYYNEATGGRYVPRAVLMDLEPGTMDSVRAGPFVFSAPADWAKQPNSKDLQLERINVYYNEANGGRYVPREVLMVLDPGSATLTGRNRIIGRPPTPA